MARFVLSAFADEAAGSLGMQLEALREEGISLIELRGIGGTSVSYLSLGEAEKIREELDRAGIRLSALGSPFGKTRIDEPFENPLADFRHGLELCRVYGCTRMRMFSFYIPAGDRPEDWRDEVLSRLEIMLSEAEKAGILLTHENEKGIYGDTAERCADILKHFDGRLGFVFDPANFVQCGVDTLNAYELLHDRITYMHIKDALKADGAVVTAGNGDGNVAEILKRLSGERQGEVILTLEPHLTVFEGLEALQKESVTHHEVYPDRRTAFHAACSALRTIIKA
ncbi:MAG: sugar phosphate isomerase/epimerase [Clostridia bacterium]|nr:sugar phosphate isomerase/epimerase [Clostridia bacterium]